jgi:hypothetical protein
VPIFGMSAIRHRGASIPTKSVRTFAPPIPRRERYPGHGIGPAQPARSHGPTRYARMWRPVVLSVSSSTRKEYLTPGGLSEPRGRGRRNGCRPKGRRYDAREQVSAFTKPRPSPAGALVTTGDSTSFRKSPPQREITTLARQLPNDTLNLFWWISGLCCDYNHRVFRGGAD